MIFLSVGSDAGSFGAYTMPKSAKQAVDVAEVEAEESRMLDGLMSRWIIPNECR